MNVPQGLFYTKEHEWARIDGDLATVGITDHAQHALGDITFVELPKIGQGVEQFKYLSTVESVKAASDVYAPVTGKVVKVNDALSGSPELVNQSPYETGWIAVIRVEDLKAKNNLMSPEAYSKYLEGLSK